MRMVVLGATGRVGRPTVERALTDGHDVVAYVRTAATIRPRPRLTVIEGSIEATDALRTAMRGADAVICLIASPSMRNGNLLQRLTPSMIRAAEAADMTRFVFASVLGVGPTLQLTDPIPRTLFRTIARPFLTDRAAAEKVIEASSLDSVIAHLLNLRDKQRTDYEFVAVDRIKRIPGIPSFPYLSAAEAVIELATLPERPAARLLVAAPGQWQAPRTRIG